MHAVNLARQFSATRSETIRLCGSADERECSGASDWSGGLLLADDGGRLRQSLGLSGGNGAPRLRSNRAILSFEAGSGFATPATLTVCDRRGAERRAGRDREPQRPPAHQRARRLGPGPHVLSHGRIARIHARGGARRPRPHAGRARRRRARPGQEHPARARVGQPACSAAARRFARRRAARARSRRLCLARSRTRLRSSTGRLPWSRPCPKVRRHSVDRDDATPEGYLIRIEWPVAGVGMQRLVLPVTT